MYNQNFKLFMTTSLNNPNYLPEIFIKTSVINFTVTFDGLNEQLLGDVASQLEPELEK